MVKDKLNGRSKRNGIIEIPADSEARRDQTMFDGKLVSVTESQIKSKW